MLDTKLGSWSAKNIWLHVRSRIRERGLLYVVYMAIKIAFFLPFSFALSKIFTPRSGFSFQGKKFPYERSWYNMTWRSERTAEIPIFRNLMKNYNTDDILEVGNVMRHYNNTIHAVVDKYEVGKEIINEDILDFETDKRYRFVFSISTLEHIGQDEENGVPEKAIDAIKKIRNLLCQGGEFCFSVPLGHNTTLDSYCYDNLNAFKKVTYMKRISRANRWVEEEISSLENIRYGHPYPFANVIFIGVIDTAAALGPIPVTNKDI